MTSPFSSLDVPYQGPSRVPLPSVYELIESGRWAVPPQDRDRSRDVTDEQIAELL